ncbi:MAG TPA: hypothetical protein PLA49_05595, partial [Propioniciclava sp.]|uniref:hypothetical protein n=1 Tax=Propioniciclava sp. TaxID=2038686 RepID=UPI002B5B7BAD
QAEAVDELLDEQIHGLSPFTGEGLTRGQPLTCSMCLLEVLGLSRLPLAAFHLVDRQDAGGVVTELVERDLAGGT